MLDTDQNRLVSDSLRSLAEYIHTQRVETRMLSVNVSNDIIARAQWNGLIMVDFNPMFERVKKYYTEKKIAVGKAARLIGQQAGWLIATILYGSRANIIAGTPNDQVMFQAAKLGVCPVLGAESEGMFGVYSNIKDDDDFFFPTCAFLQYPPAPSIRPFLPPNVRGRVADAMRIGLLRTLKNLKIGKPIINIGGLFNDFIAQERESISVKNVNPSIDMPISYNNQDLIDNELFKYEESERLYVDGDDIVASMNGWPPGRWWEEKDADQTIEKVITIMTDWMQDAECDDWVVFSGITEIPVWKRHIPDDVTIIVVEIHPANHQENLLSRAKEQVNQPTEWDVIAKDRAKLLKQAVDHKVAAFTTFDSAINNVAGKLLILATSGSGKTHFIKQHVSNTVCDQVGIGQMKLKAVNRPLYLTCPDTVVLIGGSPGYGQNSLIRKEMRVIIVDPRPHEIKHHDVIHVRALWKQGMSLPIKGKYVIIADIRPERSNFASQDDWYKQIKIDWDLMLLMAREYAGPDCLGISLKFKPVFDMLIPDGGHLCVQPYIWANSNELRWISIPFIRFPSMVMVQKSHADMFAHRWNVLRQKSQRFEVIQEKLLANLAVMPIQITDGRLPRSTVISSFALSNTSNERVLPHKILKGNNKVILILPNYNALYVTGALKTKGSKFSDLYFNEEGVDMYGNAIMYSDWVYHPCEFLQIGYVYTMHDFLLMSEYTVFGRRMYERTRGCHGTHPNMFKWMVVSNFKLHRSDLQTWTNSQTQFARIEPGAVRRGKGMGKKQSHFLRTLAAKTLFPQLNIATEKEYHAEGVIDSRFYQLDVSGHMVGIISAGHYYIVDFRRLMDNLEASLKIASHIDRSIMLEFKRFSKNGVLAESNWEFQNRIWHTYYEWYAGVASGLLSSSLYHGSLCPYEIKGWHYVLTRLKKLKKKYPILLDQKNKLIK
jgi:hypothetical protein